MDRERQLQLLEIPNSIYQNEYAQDLVGVIRRINSPFNLYMRLTDFFNNSSYIYFVVYSIGKRKIILWGVYDKINKNFIVDSSCRYTNLNDLQNFRKASIQHNYSYVGNIVQNKINETLSRFSNISPFHFIKSYDDYINYKFLIGFNEGKIPFDMIPIGSQEFVKDAPLLINEFDYDNIKKEIIQYESKYVNRNDVPQNIIISDNVISALRKIPGYENLSSIDLTSILKNKIAPIIEDLTKQFQIQIQTSEYVSSLFYDQLNTCPNLSNCNENDTNNKGCNMYFYGTGLHYYPGDIAARDNSIL